MQWIHTTPLTFPLGHDYPEAPKQLHLTWVLNQLKPLLESSCCKKIGQHLKYDKNVLAQYDIQLSGIRFDTMMESYVLNATATRHDMDALARHYLNVNTTTYESIAGTGINKQTLNQVAIERVGPYAAEDADIALRLHHALWPQLEKNSVLMNVYETIEYPLIDVLSRMEQKGTLIDVHLLKQHTQDLQKRLEILEQESFQLANQEFNLESPKQLRDIFFKELNIPVIRKTPKGQPSTAEDVLSELALNYPLPKKILEYRSLSKLRSTYTDKLPHMIDSVTGRLHTSYHQAITATGRLSSSHPNLQNIPIKTKEGRRIRQAFIAPPGYCLVAADYSQIELRIMAHLSKDKGLLNAFAEQQDIHCATASEVFWCPFRTRHTSTTPQC